MKAMIENFSRLHTIFYFLDDHSSYDTTHEEFRSFDIHILYFKDRYTGLPSVNFEYPESSSCFVCAECFDVKHISPHSGFFYFESMKQKNRLPLLRLLQHLAHSYLGPENTNVLRT